MNSRNKVTASALAAMCGNEIGISRWFEISQDRIDAFAELTEDPQFIHTDPARAANTPFGGTIAHGFLTVSMLSAMALDALPEIEGSLMGINYGFDKIRFLSPVPSGSRIRGKFTHLHTDERKPGELTAKYRVDVEIEGQNRLAMSAEWITRQHYQTS